MGHYTDVDITENFGKTLIVVDMQNDFIDGALGTPEAQAIVPRVKQKIEEYRERGYKIVFTQDTHFDDYLDTMEGAKLPVPHCIKDTHGWQIADGLYVEGESVVEKYQFGYPAWDNLIIWSGEMELVGLCTDICVISNALIMKSMTRTREITVDASCCAGTTPENHKAALQVMKSCQINVIGE